VVKNNFSIKLATLWKINDHARCVYPVFRVGYEPNLENTSEYIHPIKNSFIGKVLEEITKTGNTFWSTDDLQNCPFFIYHRVPERAKALNLHRVYCIPFRNYHSHPKNKSYAGIFNLYVADQVQLSADFLTFLSCRLSEIYSTQFIIHKDLISEAMLNIFSLSVTLRKADEILRDVLQNVCLPLL